MYVAGCGSPGFCSVVFMRRIHYSFMSSPFCRWLLLTNWCFGGCGQLNERDSMRCYAYVFFFFISAKDVSCCIGLDVLEVRHSSEVY